MNFYTKQNSVLNEYLNKFLYFIAVGAWKLSGPNPWICNLYLVMLLKGENKESCAVPVVAKVISKPCMRYEIFERVRVGNCSCGFFVCADILLLKLHTK
jgi:hypothetical protein